MFVDITSNGTDKVHRRHHTGNGITKVAGRHHMKRTASVAPSVFEESPIHQTQKTQDSQKLFELIENNVIGKDFTFSGAFGLRKGEF